MKGRLRNRRSLMSELLKPVWLCALLIFYMHEGLAHDHKEELYFDIPATSIDKALNQLGQQANAPVLFPYDRVQHLNFAGIKGLFTLQDALACVVRETDLQVQITNDRVIAVTTASRASSRKPHPGRFYIRDVDASFCGGKTEKPQEKVVVDPAPEPDQGFFLEEVFVTARRYTELITDIPLSLTSVSGEQLSLLGAKDLTVVGQISPNVTFSTTGAVSGSTSSAVVYIRGVGQNDYVPAIDPSVGIYVDDVYYGRSIGSAFNLFDIHQIEVLRGPQGTLFGRNTIGGAVSVTTNSPTGDNSGVLRLNLGDQGRREAFLTQNFVLSDDVIANVNLVRQRMEGTVERVNLPNSPNLGDENSVGARVKFDWKASDRLQLQLAGDYGREREQSAPEVNLRYQDDQGLPGAFNGLDLNLAPLAAFSNAEGCVAGDSQAGTNCYNDRFQLGPFATAETSLSRNNVETWGVSAIATMQSEDKHWYSKAILSHRQLEAFLARQADGSPLDVFENREAYFSQQSSLELRAVGKYDSYSLTGGLFYFTEKSDNQLDFGGAFNGTLFPVHYGGLVANENFSAYGQVNFDVFERFHLNAGLRYTDEIKQATPNAFNFSGCNIDLAPLTPNDCAVTGSGFLVPRVEQRKSFDRLTWSASLAYDLSDDTNVYFKASTGFKSGGFEWRVVDDSFARLAISEAQSRGLPFNDAVKFVETHGALPSFDPENLTSLEVGIKGELLEHGLRYGISFFDSTFKNQTAAINVQGIATIQTNAAESSQRGAEIELKWVLSKSLAFDFSGGYIDAHYNTLTQGALAAGLSLDNKPIYTPKWNSTLGISYSHSLQTYRVVPRVAFVSKSSQEFEPINTPFTRDEGYTSTDLSVRLESKSGRWYIDGRINNASNELYKVSGDSNNVIGYENVIFARPRNVYLSFNYNW